MAGLNRDRSFSVQVTEIQPKERPRIWVWIVIVLLFVMAAEKVWMNNGAEEQAALAAQEPVDTVLDSLENYGAGAPLDKLVIPYNEFTVNTKEGVIEVSVPLIQAEFAEGFNTRIIQWVENLLENAQNTLVMGNTLQHRSITYQAFLEKDILTVLLRTEYATGESDWEPWIFDLKQEGKLLEPWELAKSLLGMDYATFLWVTDRWVQNCFVDAHWGQFRGVPEDEMPEAQYLQYENYVGILAQIPMDISNAVNRWVFPADGTVYLMYDLPILSDNWQSGLMTQAGLTELGGSVFSLARTVTAKEAVADVVFSSDVYSGSGSDQPHAQLVRQVFYGAPKAFLEVVADLEGQEYAVESLLRYAGEAELQKIGEICTELRAGGNLTKEENAAAYLLLASVKAASQPDPES